MPDIFKDYWTTSDLCHIFDRSVATIWNWRTGKELPFENFGSEKHPIIRFKKNAIRRWSKKNSFALVRDPDDLMEKKVG